MTPNLLLHRGNKGRQLITKLNLQLLYIPQKAENLQEIMMLEKDQAELFHKEQDQI